MLTACLLAFLPGLHGPFLHDDYANLQLSRVGPFNWQALWDASFRNSSGPLGRPLANASFALTRWTLGGEPFDFKLVNLLLHGLCGLLVYALAQRLLALFRLLDDDGRRLAATATMLLWTLHPLQVSTVLYAVQRMTQLAAIFMLAGSWWFARWLESGKRKPANAVAAAAVFGACLLLGVAGKETSVLLPMLAAAIALAARVRGNLPHDRASILFLALCVALPALTGLASMAWKWDWLMAAYATRDFDAGERLLTEAAALWFYLRLLVLPWVPSMGLFHDDFPVYGPYDWQGWLAAAAWVLALAAAWRWRRQTPMALFALTWFLGAHLLESTFLPLELVYEHRNYVALFGPLLWFMSVLAPLLQRQRTLRRVGWTIPALLLGAATMTRSHQWSSGDLFAIYEYRHHPQSIRAGFMEAGRRIIAHDVAGAAQLYAGIQRRVERDAPDSAWPLMLDALLQCRLGGHPVRWDELRARIARNPTLDRTLEFSSAVMSQLAAGSCGPLQVGEFRRTLEAAYRAALAHGDTRQAALAASHLGWTWITAHQPAYARRWLRRAADANPADPEPLFDLAYLELNAGHADTAQSLMEELRARARDHRLPIDYRIAELDVYLQQERAKADAK